MKKIYRFDLRIHVLKYQLMFIKNKVWSASRKINFGEIIFVNRRIYQWMIKIINKNVIHTQVSSIQLTLRIHVLNCLLMFIKNRVRLVSRNFFILAWNKKKLNWRRICYFIIKKGIRGIPWYHTIQKVFFLWLLKLWRGQYSQIPPWKFWLRHYSSLDAIKVVTKLESI